MPIIQEVTEKKFLTEEEKTTLKDIQTKSQSLVAELGEISMIKIQIENRYENAKSYLTEVSNQEKEFTKTLFDKYGKFNLDPQTGEIIITE
jgi:phosphopantetheine adenylyltransferase